MQRRHATFVCRAAGRARTPWNAWGQPTWVCEGPKDAFKGRSTGPGFPVSKLEPLYDACARELDSRPIKDASSQSESRFRARSVDLLSRIPRVSVRPSACYLHGFEADIVLTVLPHADSGLCVPVTVNVEVDGPRHRSRGKRLLCSVRDAHLRSRGVTVLRWDLMAKDGDSGPAFDEWLRREIQGLLGGGLPAPTSV